MLDFPAPTQDWSKKVLERFLNVAAGLLANNQFEEAGVSQLATLSDSSVGIFYRLFGDKDVLLFAVHERFRTSRTTAFTGVVIDRNRNSCSDNASADSLAWQAGCSMLADEWRPAAIIG